MAEDDGVTGTGAPGDPLVFPPEVITVPGSGGDGRHRQRHGGRSATSSRRRSSPCSGSGDDGSAPGTGAPGDPIVFPPLVITAPGPDDSGATGSGTDGDPYVFPPQVITGPDADGVTGTGAPGDPIVFPPEVITAPGPDAEDGS